MQAFQAGGDPELAVLLHGGQIAALFFEETFAHRTGEIFAHTPDHEVVFQPGALVGKGGGFFGSFFHRLFEQAVSGSGFCAGFVRWRGKENVRCMHLWNSGIEFRFQ